MVPSAIVISRSMSGQTVLMVLRSHLRVSSAEAHRLIRQRSVRLGGKPCHDAQLRLRQGQRLEVQIPQGGPRPRTGPERSPRHDRILGPILPGGVEAPRLRHVDSEIVVVEKPAGLTTVRHRDEVAQQGPRASRYLPPTLADILPAMVAAETGKPPGRLRAVHRLDKETTGLLVFARTPTAEGNLGRQFRAHKTERIYLALVRGEAKPQRIESTFVPDRGDGRRGSAVSTAGGQHAVTHVRVVERMPGYTLVECMLETGRTHQVRIHLGEAGTPLCGDHVYDRPLHGAPLPDRSGAKRVALHAATLGFDHPRTGQRVHWTSKLPQDMEKLLRLLRNGTP